MTSKKTNKGTKKKDAGNKHKSKARSESIGKKRGFTKRTASDNSKAKNPMSRRYCFTIYPDKAEIVTDDEGKPIKNPTDDDYMAFPLQRYLLYLLNSIPHARGIIASIEKGDSKEHAHVQGYVELTYPLRWKRIKASLHETAHIEVARAERQDNIDYISHNGKHVNKGTLLNLSQVGDFPSISGEEFNILDDAVTMVLEGTPIPIIVRHLKGSILPYIAQLYRLQTECMLQKAQKDSIQRARELERQREQEQQDYNFSNGDVPF